MKYHLPILLITIFLLSNILLGQNVFVKWYNTELHEFIWDIECIQDEDEKFVYILNKNQYPPSILYQTEIMSSSSNTVYLTDYEFNQLDSLSINEVDGYRVTLWDIWYHENDSIILCGYAYDSAIHDMQICLVWLNDQLNIIKDSLYGNLEDIDYPGSTISNFNENIVFHEIRNPDWIENNTGKDEELFFWEIDRAGNTVQIVMDITDCGGLVPLGPSGKYHASGLNSLVQLNPDFSIDTSYYFEIQNFRIWYKKYFEEIL